MNTDNIKCWSVYVHTTPENKVYVGATSKPPKVRWNYGYGYRDSVFYGAILEYGWNNIIHEIVATDLSKTEAHELEKTLIAKYNSTNPNRGYNLSVGGHGSTGVVITEETRKKLSVSHMGKTQHRTPEWNKKIADSNTGKPHPHKGVPRSETCREKISEKHRKSVLQYDKNLILIAEYPSIREASRATRIKNQNISNCCLGKSLSAGGFIWRHKSQ